MLLSRRTRQDSFPVHPDATFDQDHVGKGSSRIEIDLKVMGRFH